MRIAYLGVGLGAAILAVLAALQPFLQIITDLPAVARVFSWSEAVTLMIVAPTVEEYCFRRGLVGVTIDTGRFTPAQAVIFSSSVFAVLHSIQGAGGIAVAFVAAMCLGTAYAVTRSLPLVIVAHATINGASMAIAWAIL